MRKKNLMEMPTDNANLTSSLTGFYAVPLVCEAAAQIGCGCRAKPLLAALEGQEMVKRAWLRRSGTTVAVQWHQQLPQAEAVRIVNTAFVNEGEIKAVEDDKFEELLNDLRHGSQWYSLQTIDQLSIEEADLIATRMVHRLSPKVDLRSINLLELHCAIACACRDILVNDKAESLEWRRPALNRAIVDALRLRLDSDAMAALGNPLIFADHRPMADEL
jgi:hypothetical protein